MDSLKLFETTAIRSFYDEEREQWYFSLVDVVELLTDSTNPTDYLKKLRKRDTELGNYLGTNCPQIANRMIGNQSINELVAYIKNIYHEQY